MRQFDLANMAMTTEVTPAPEECLILTYRKAYDNGMVVQTTGYLPLEGLDQFSTIDIKDKFHEIMRTLREEANHHYRVAMGWEEPDQPEQNT